MRFLYRLRWDELYTPWHPVTGELLRALVDDGTPAVLRVEPPTHWHFNTRMIHDLAGQIAVESTLIHIELKGVK